MGMTVWYHGWIMAIQKGQTTGRQRALQPFAEPGEFLGEEARDRLHSFILEEAAHGRRPMAMAQKLARGNTKRRKLWLARIWRALESDRLLHDRIARRAQAELALALPAAAAGLARRSSGGRPDAVKLVFEASGFYNPKVNHNHSGEVTIRLEGIPRPPRRVDAEVSDE